MNFVREYENGARFFASARTTAVNATSASSTVTVEFVTIRALKSEITATLLLNSSTSDSVDLYASLPPPIVVNVTKGNTNITVSGAGVSGANGSGAPGCGLKVTVGSNINCAYISGEVCLQPGNDCKTLDNNSTAVFDISLQDVLSTGPLTARACVRV